MDINTILDTTIYFLKNNIINILFNVSLIMCIACAFGLLTKAFHEKKLTDELYNVKGDKKKKRKSVNDSNNILKTGFLGTLFQRLEIYLAMSNREKSVNLVFYIILVVGLALGISLFSTGQKLMGVLLPFIIWFLISYVISLIKIDRIQKIREQLPITINNLTRVMSKYGSLKTILYETSVAVPDPMQSVLRQLSLKMSSEGPIDVLNDFMNEYNDIWIYSFAFTLQSYLENSEKKDVLSNLKELRDIIDKEVEQKKSEALEKKMTVSINYFLVFLGIAAEIANIMFNPGAQAFFFRSVPGFGCFLGGNALLIVCIISNILLTKK